MTEPLADLYEIFLLEKIKRDYLSKYDKFEILGAKFIYTYFCVLVEVKNIFKQEYYFIVENLKDSVIFQLKRTDEQSPYIKFEKKHFRNRVGEKIFDILAKRGLCTQEHIALSSGTNPLSIHRLITCLYQNIIGLEVHHNNKNKADNRISNLSPITHKYHDFLDKQQGEKYEKLTSILHKNFREKVCKEDEKRNTLANRKEIVLDVLGDLASGKSVKDISNEKIKKTKIYELKKYYFYLNEFINYLREFINLKFVLLNGNLSNLNIENFIFNCSEKLNSCSTLEFKTFLIDFFKTHDKKT